MADIKPFNGYRFSVKKPEDLGALIAPPYDMLDAKMIDELYAKHPANVVRVTQNKPQVGDTANRDRHVRAAQCLQEWIVNGTMVKDDKPSVYLYEQKFSYKAGAEVKEAVRTGVVVLVKLVEFADKVVLPHEATLSGPKIDRYELLEACSTHTEQIFGLLEDNGDFYATLRSMPGGTPDGTFTDATGVRHSLYRCSDVATIEKLVKLAQGKTILIADGHHRYETGLNYYKATGMPEHAYTMMTLVSTADPGLVIRPFHRLIKKAGKKVDMRASLSAYFTMTDLGNVAPEIIYQFIGSSDERSLVYVDSASQHAFGCVLSDSGKKFLTDNMADKSMVWKTLPVSLINMVVINTILDLPLDGHVLHDVVDYLNDVNDAVKLCADSATYHGGFFIRPSTISTVGVIVANDERMPQKSTNFYPKIFSGLVMYGMGEK